MVARKPVSSSTVTQLLMMENQWICTGMRSMSIAPVSACCPKALPHHYAAVHDAESINLCRHVQPEYCSCQCILSEGSLVILPGSMLAVDS